MYADKRAHLLSFIGKGRGTWFGALATDILTIRHFEPPGFE
jgi:hypothetical protein